MYASLNCTVRPFMGLGGPAKEIRVVPAREKPAVTPPPPSKPAPDQEPTPQRVPEKVPA